MFTRIIDVEGVPEDQVVRVLLRQTVAQQVESRPAVARSRYDKLRIDWYSIFVIDRGDEPGGVGIVGGWIIGLVAGVIAFNVVAGWLTEDRYFRP